jgi:hypothetical protein
VKWGFILRVVEWRVRGVNNREGELMKYLSWDVIN